MIVPTATAKRILYEPLSVLVDYRTANVFAKWPILAEKGSLRKVSAGG
jgi:hypothetical protein